MPSDCLKDAKVKLVNADQLEITRLRAELVKTRTERNILKKTNSRIWCAAKAQPMVRRHQQDSIRTSFFSRKRMVNRLKASLSAHPRDNLDLA